MVVRKDILKNIASSAAVSEMLQGVKSGRNVIAKSLSGVAKALVAALLCKEFDVDILFIVGNSRDKSAICDDLDFFGINVYDFPFWEALPTEDMPPSVDVVGERYNVLSNILNYKEPAVFVAGISAVQQKTLSPDTFDMYREEIFCGDLRNFKDFAEQLSELGYTRCTSAVGKGEFAVRSNIIDVFPITSLEPYRLCFSNDKVGNIYSYDPIGQRTVGEVKSFLLTPSQEKELLDDNDTATLLSYLRSPIVIYDNFLEIENKNIGSCDLLKNFVGYKDFMKLCEEYIQFFCVDGDIDDSSINGSARSLYHWEHPFISLQDYMGSSVQCSSNLLDVINKIDLVKTFAVSSSAERLHLQQKINEKIHCHEGYLSSNFIVKDLNILYFPYSEITKKRHVRRKKMRITHHSVIPEINSLSVGDLVVHYSHGIGKYLGTEFVLKHNGKEAEFFVLEFADNIKHFVPISQAYLVNKYIGSHEERPRLDKIGSPVWERARTRTEQSIVVYAKELLEVYAQRKINGGHSCCEDSLEMKLFEEEFPYTETEDQQQAIIDVKADLCSAESMDRLVCGDVGYGKTEVAMRAAFKAVVDGKKQVAVLVPTTVLAMQHYDNFIERMCDYPINIAVLSRYITASRKREVLEQVEQGKVDILIGTHRIISADVNFADLGLVIIDEEQRFGVRVKDYLKKIKVGVDCLTLSATPIPRTLYMSLVGARDMSVINTPPQDRLPVRTDIIEWDDDNIKNIILRELSRDGQVYFLHNRVETIHCRADELRALLPQARILIVHGQMHATEIGDIFKLFKNGEADVMLATTLIESGIDIPNVNTIIIDQADHFGLSDLYQLRGRVGRWNRQAYAYLLVSSKDQISEISQRRLKALVETGGYGGGMRLAMCDLEIRGAGDIIGVEQSGHVHAIGFHLYCKLLKKTVDGMQKGRVITFLDTKVEFPYDAYIPKDYIYDATLRMEFYYRLGDADDVAVVEDMFLEMKNRFGELPQPVIWLKHIARIRIFASQRYFVLLKFEKVVLTVRMQKGMQSQEHKFVIGQCEDPIILEKKIVEILG